MPLQLPKHLLIYRMTHIDNIPFIVKNGLWAKLSSTQDPNYIQIGNPAIIDRRTNKPVGITPPGGVLGEFIPFYFAGQSPMLLNIATGHNVDRVPQKEIVFLVCDALEIINVGIPFCFTDGNAAQSVSRFYNNLMELKNLDWDAIRATMWMNTEDDYDRQRKKMSEFLAKKHVPARLIKWIVVKNLTAQQKVLDMLGDVPLDCPVKVDVKNKLYYRRYD